MVSANALMSARAFWSSPTAYRKLPAPAQHPMLLSEFHRNNRSQSTAHCDLTVKSELCVSKVSNAADGRVTDLSRSGVNHLPTPLVVSGSYRKGPRMALCGCDITRYS